MKVIVFAVLAMCVVLVSCRPDKPDLKKLKEEANRKKTCMSDCGKAQFEPVCAAKNGEKPKSFGNQCVLNNHNCENKDSLQVISKGECPGSTGIRLS